MIWQSVPALLTLISTLLTVSSAEDLNQTALSQKYFGNDAPWYIDRVPFFESSDSVITDVYYYRWQIFRAHQRDLGANGFISTEFLDDVGWQTLPWASLNDATGFHLLEGRWCRDRRFKADYATFIFSSNSNTRQFTETMASAVWQGYLVDGDSGLPLSLLPNMQSVFNAWSDSFDASKNLYWVEPLRDATEYTIASIDASGGLDGFTGGESFRPSVNSFQYANAKAIANIALLNNDNNISELYNERAASIKTNVQSSLWNSTFEHFIDRIYKTTAYVTYWDMIRGRELVGYVPWTHDLPDDTAAFAQSWKHVLNTSELSGAYGLRTNEPSYEYYMKQYRYEGNRRECQWNGPAWVLTGLGNLLDHYTNTTQIATISDFNYILRQYALLHYTNGILNLQEDYDADTGKPIVGLDRSPHYFHSGYIDIVLNNYVGIRPREDDVLEVNPLVESTTTEFFRADRIPYHGHLIAVQWDATGSRYGNQGLQVEIDGTIVASQLTLGRITIPIARQQSLPIAERICVSVQLQSSSTYPAGSVSVSGADPEKVHDSIDGRIYFFPESTVANGWETPIGNGSQVWYSINFGTVTGVGSAEIAFFANDGQGFAVPESYKIQAFTTSWQDVVEEEYDIPVANGITLASWKPVQAQQIRILFTPKSGSRIRLVEFKVFS